MLMTVKIYSATSEEIVTELVEILQEYETATNELILSYTNSKLKITELEKGSLDLKMQINDLQTSLDDSKVATNKEINELKFSNRLLTVFVIIEGVAITGAIIGWLFK